LYDLCMCTRFMAQFDMGSEKNQKTGGEKCYEFGWNPDPSNAPDQKRAVAKCIGRQPWRPSSASGC
jgi:hypothetical protein